jgi:hypothetical protein
MSYSSLATAIDAISRCSDAELFQIRAVIDTKLGNTAPTTQSRGKVGVKAGGTRGKTPGRNPRGRKARRGNPQRKSQFSTHPLYRQYISTKKVLAAEVKKTPGVTFKTATGPSADAYRTALEAWYQAKCGFRSKKNKAEQSSDSSEDLSVPEEAPMVPAQRDGSITSVPDSRKTQSEPARKRIRSEDQESPGDSDDSERSHPSDGSSSTAEGQDAESRAKEGEVQKPARRSPRRSGRGKISWADMDED